MCSLTLREPLDHLIQKISEETLGQFSLSTLKMCGFSPFNQILLSLNGVSNAFLN